jgi:signal transduction histidine kinase
MTKSLYVRVVITFVASVMLSLILAFFLATLLYKNQVNALVEAELIDNGKQIIRNYEQSSVDGLNGFIKGMGLIHNYKVQIYDSNGAGVNANNGNPIDFHIKKEWLDYVLKGGVYRSATQSSHGPKELLVGLPFQVDNVPYALFISPDVTDLIREFGNLLKTVLIIVLVLGSLFIAIAARYLVKPLHKLTEATRRLAKGDFSVHVHSKRKDEVGVLTESINDMAQELGMLDQMRQDFVANVSHEIQSPLTSIKGFSKALKNKSLDEAKRIHYLTIIDEESERLSRLSENLLKLSSLQYEHHPFHPEYFRLDEQLRGIIIASEPQWAAKKQVVDLQLSEVTIQGDEDQLQQIWLNLIYNSIKFTPELGSISIALKTKGSNAIITITDTGIGIPAEEIDHIFKPFYKVDKARSGSYSGSGLGLSIVKRIADIHHGDIEITSNSGEGTTIKLLLPLESKM